MQIPLYAELRRPVGERLPLAWGVWGPDDEIGMWNNLSPLKTAEAARLVRNGLRFNLNLPLDEPLGLLPAGAHATRRAPVHSILEFAGDDLFGRDDKITFYPQASTQWDGLTHVGDARHGFYNGVRPAPSVPPGDIGNGIDKVAEFGIATRAVLIDLPSHFAAVGRDWKVVGSQVATEQDLADCLARTGQTLTPGDVLLVRTGWLAAFRAANPDARRRLFCERDYSGLSGDEGMWQFLWDNRVAAVVSDNVAVEMFPLVPDRPSLHRAIARLGLTLGELFDLDALAEYSIGSHRYESFFVAMPLNVPGGVGSPGNAMALV